MAAATITQTTYGRNAPMGNVTVIPAQITATATVYAAASGGLPIDIASVLLAAVPDDNSFIHPEDVVDIQGWSTGLFQVANWAVGTPTYTTVAGVSAQGATENKLLATCPGTVRMFATGAGANAAFGQIADGAVTDVLNVWIYVARGGPNR